MGDSNTLPAITKKVSLTTIMEQKKTSHASVSALQQTSSAAEPERPRRTLAALMCPAAVTGQPLPGGHSLTAPAVRNSLQHQETPMPQYQQTVGNAAVAAEPHADQKQNPLQKLSSRLQQLTGNSGSQATQAGANTTQEAATQPKQSLAARLQQLNHKASEAATAAAPASHQQQQQQQQQQSRPTLKALTQPNWDRKSRAFRTLDALAAKPSVGTSASGQGSTFSQGFMSPQRSAPSGGPGSGGPAAADRGGTWRGLIAAGLDKSSTAAGAAAAAAQAGDQIVAAARGQQLATTAEGAVAEEQWDRDLADRAADLLWEEDEQQQQQQRKKRRRQQQNPDHTDSSAAAAAAAAGLVVGSLSASGGGSRGATKRQQAEVAASAAAAAVCSIPDGVRDALLSEDAALPLNPAVGVLGTAGGVLGLGVTDDQGPPADPLDLINPKTGLHLQVPGSINRHLRSYQREGVQFLFKMYCKGRGGVLSDDMGLGKTVQAISFLAALLGKTGTMADALPRNLATAKQQQQQQQVAGQQAGDAAAAAVVRWPVLVVAPTSVLDNWVREFNMWGHFKVDKFSTSSASHIQEQAALGTLEVILTSYDQLRIKPDNILGLKPYVVIFDEAHRLKNNKSRVYEAVKKGLRTKFRYGLSGTIMPNNHEELWSVLDILVPGCLGDYKEYSEYYGKPIRKGQSRTAKQWEIRKGAERLSQLQDLLQKVYLRRTKAIIADQLPKKKDNIVFCQLKPLQYRAYDRTLASPDLQALQRSHDPCDCGSGLLRGQCCYDTVPPESGGVLWPHYHLCSCSDPDCKRHRPEGCAEYYRQQGKENARIVCPNCLMLPAISLLQKISNHLDLIRPDARLAQQDEQQFEYQLKLAHLVLGDDDASALGGLVSNSGGWLGASDETHCGKMATLQALLHKWSCDRSQHNKVLIFSHSTRCLDLLEKFVQRAGYDYVRLDGSTAQKQRQLLVDEFNSRPSIFLFLMSTLAGGVGLNLTAANKVVVFDPSWNPSNDLQAQDRAYRLGQTRDVEVFRLVGTGTLEELVYRRQIYKQQQANMVLENKQEARYFEGVQGDKDKQGELWGLQNLLRFSGHTIETRDILNTYQEGSSERQRLERQLQQQQERVQRGAAAAGEVAEDAARTAGSGGGAGRKGNTGFEIVEVDDLGEVPQDPTAAVDGSSAVAAAPMLLADVLDINSLQQAPEFLEGDEAAAVVGLAGPVVRRPKQQQQHGVDTQGSRRRHRKGYTAADDLGEGGADYGEEEDEDVIIVGQQQQQQQRKGRLRRTSAGIMHHSSGKEVAAGSSDQEDSSSDMEVQQDKEKQQRRRRQRQQHDDVGSDSPAASIDEQQAAGQHAAGAGGSDDTGFPLQSATAAAAGGGGAAYGSGSQVLDSLVVALQDEGVILHMHTHDSVLGRGEKKVPRRRQVALDHEQLAEQQQQQQREHSKCPKPQLSATTASPLAAGAAAEDPRAAAAKRASAAVLTAAIAAADHGDSIVASLSVWQQMPVADVAQLMFDMNNQERRELLVMYAADMAVTATAEAGV